MASRQAHDIVVWLRLVSTGAPWSSVRQAGPVAGGMSMPFVSPASVLPELSRLPAGTPGNAVIEVTAREHEVSRPARVDLERLAGRDQFALRELRDPARWGPGTLAGECRWQRRFARPGRVAPAASASDAWWGRREIPSPRPSGRVTRLPGSKCVSLQEFPTKRFRLQSHGRVVAYATAKVADVAFPNALRPVCGACMGGSQGQSPHW